MRNQLRRGEDAGMSIIDVGNHNISAEVISNQSSVGRADFPVQPFRKGGGFSIAQRGSPKIPRSASSTALDSHFHPGVQLFE